MILQFMKLTYYYIWLVDDEYESTQVIIPRLLNILMAQIKDPQVYLYSTKGVCIDVESIC